MKKRFSLNAIGKGRFSSQALAADLSTLMLKHVMHVSRTDFSISDADLGELKAARRQSRAQLDAGFSKMIGTTEERRRNLKTYDGIEFVSLGTDCLSRSVPTRWGLKKPGKLGELSQPFDLAVHPLAATLALLKGDFAGYLDPANLQFSPKTRICLNKKYRVQFNHEVGEDYAENAFQKLIEVYTRRVANFQSLLASDRRIVFLSHVRGLAADSVAILEEIAGVIAEKRGHDRSMFVVIDSYERELHKPFGAALKPGFYLVDAPRPYQGYVWHYPKDTFSDGGYRFERGIIDGIKRAVRQHGWGRAGRLRWARLRFPASWSPSPAALGILVAAVDLPF